MSEPAAFHVELPERGVKLAVLDWGGTGPVVLCAHANGFCARLWQGVADALAGRYRVLAYDARGHGDSSAPPPPHGYDWESLGDDLLALAAALCARLGVARIDCGVGNSMGGTAMMIAASQAPERFGRLALVDPVVLPPPVPGRSLHDRGRKIAARASERRQVFPSRAAVIDAYRERELFSDWEPWALEAYAEHGFRERPDGQVELCCAGAVEGAIFARSIELDLFGIVRGLKVPGELMHATRGNFDVGIYRQLAAVAPGLEVGSLDGGHLAPMSDPRRVAARISALVERAA